MTTGRDHPAPPHTGWLGLDVGGANLKAAHSAGMAVSMPFALWRAPEALAGRLAELLANLPPADRVALTLTAELCDCYPTKADGVRAVLAAVSSVVPEPHVAVWGIDGAFHPVAEAHARPSLAAAANWRALATVAARLVPEGPALLIDIGSTTTDLIPLRDGRPAARGLDDTQRLRNGELVYAGVTRTPVCALATELTWRGGPIGLAAELFATTADVYLTLGDLPPDPADLDTSDGRPRTLDAARDRLARMVGADRDGFTAADARELARAADTVLFARLLAAAERALAGAGLGQPRAVVLSGSGAFLARRLAARLVTPGGLIHSLSDAWGPAASIAACASALVRLAAEQGAPVL